jgi:copper chaperone
METTIKVDNLKCGGCATSVEIGLSSIPGVLDVKVDPEQAEVTIQHTKETEISAVKEKLRKLGYPETGTAEGLEKIALGAKSYMSCAIGKLTKKDEDQRNNLRPIK